jgi:hypothetical protein
MRTLFSTVVLGWALTTSAQAVTVSLSATLGEIGQNYVAGDGVLGHFALGESVTFSFDYVPDDDAAPGDANGMKYVVTDFTISTAAYTGTVFDRGALKFSHQDGYDVFSMYSGYEDLTEGYGVPIPGVPLLDGSYLSSFGFNLEATRGGAFTSDSLNQALVASDFGGFNLHFAFREPGSALAAGTMQSWRLDSLSSTLNPVPEPATGALLALGLGALALQRHRAAGRR